MSTVESVFWHILGYSVIPLILLAGIVISSAAFFLLLKIFKYRGDQ
jgi:uncharacterized protein (TIGR02808 family)